MIIDDFFPRLALAIAIAVIFMLAMVAAAWFSRVVAHSPSQPPRYRMTDVQCIWHNDGTMWRAFVRAPERDCETLPRASTPIKRGDLL